METKRLLFASDLSWWIIYFDGCHKWRIRIPGTEGAFRMHSWRYGSTVGLPGSSYCTTVVVHYWLVLLAPVYYQLLPVDCGTRSAILLEVMDLPETFRNERNQPEQESLLTTVRYHKLQDWNVTKHFFKRWRNFLPSLPGSTWYQVLHVVGTTS